MQMSIRAFALGCGLLMLAACGHKDKDAPLAFVPADTPYLVANLEPLDADTRTALLDQADTQLPAQVAQLRDAADRLDADKKADLAGLLRALATELDGKTTQQIAAADGLRLDGRVALYGLGLAPVARMELDDPAKFGAFVDRLEQGYGHKLDRTTLGKFEYRHTVLGDSPLQLVIAVDDKQAMIAVLPADADQALLRHALGVDRPDESAQERGRLAKLAKANGYQPYAVGYLDSMRLAELLADGNDPMVRAFHKDAAAAVATTPACRSELQRVAARMPMMSFGYTRLEAKRMAQRFDVNFASDIIKAFAGTKVAVPGLGGGTAAPFDLVLALPMERIRTFWTAQADAVAAQPFTCPMLTDLNAQFAKLRQNVSKTATPPFGDLLGLRISLDSFAADASGGMPKVGGRLLVASSNPAGLLAMAQAMLPALAELKLSADGRPAALPAQVTGMAGAPAWAAMNDKALAIGVGAGEDARLGDMLQAAGGDAGQLFRMHVDGDMYAKWIGLVADRATALATASSTGGADDEAGRRMAAQFDAARAQAARIKQVSIEGHFDERGLVVTSQTELR